MREIAVLPPHVVDQIAAGEVIERPSSVVKELVDNAIDAGARTITVETTVGGRGMVRVHDDGIGMSPKDAVLAFQRHATSKLRDVDDLWTLSSMGFRGEALPSIASVSRLTLTTRRDADLAATRVQFEGGTLVGVTEVGAPVGTTVEVLDLLYNVPARLKFLKSEATEAAHITDFIAKIAIAHPHLHLRLRHNGRTALDLPPDRDGRARVAALLGTRVASRMISVVGEEDGMRVEAYLGAPELAQATPRGVQLFVGKRAVKDRGLLHAVAMGYGELIPRGRYPVAVVLLDCPAGAVDVNVHPQKVEVRFADPPAVAAAVRHIVQGAVARAAWRAEGGPGPVPLFRDSSGSQMTAIASVAPPALPLDGTGASALAQRYARQLQDSRRSFRPGDIEDEMQLSLASERPAPPRQSSLSLANPSLSTTSPGSPVSSGASRGGDLAADWVKGVREHTRASRDLEREADRAFARATSAATSAALGASSETSMSAATSAALGASSETSMSESGATSGATSMSASLAASAATSGAASPSAALGASSETSMSESDVTSGATSGATATSTSLSTSMAALSGASPDLRSPRIEDIEPPAVLAEGSEPVVAVYRAENVHRAGGDAGRATGYYARLRYLGQLDLTYLVCEAAGELVLIDQHAAHERVELHRLLARSAARDIATQKMLFPMTVSAPPAQLELVGRVGDTLAQVGFEAEPFGKGTIAIKAVPAGIRHGDPAQLLRKLLDDWSPPGTPTEAERQARMTRMLAEIACHSVVRAGDRLEAAQAEPLLRALDDVDASTPAPHGRAVLLRFPLGEIARRFGR